MKAWAQKKTNKKKIMSMISLAVVIGFFTSAWIFAPFSEAITAGLITLGVISDCLLPYISLKKRISETNKEIAAYKNLLANKPQELDQRDRFILLEAVEQEFILKDSNKVELMQIKELITNKSFAEIKHAAEANPILQKIIGKISFEDYVQQKRQQQIAEHSLVLTRLETNKNQKKQLLINGIVSVAASIMIAIPFPPVQIAGAILLAGTFIVAAQIKFGLLTNIAKLFKYAFSKEKPTLNEKLIKGEEPTPKPSLTPTLSSTALVFNNSINKPVKLEGPIPAEKEKNPAEINKTVPITKPVEVKSPLTRPISP